LILAVALISAGSCGGGADGTDSGAGGADASPNPRDTAAPADVSITTPSDGGGKTETADAPSDGGSDTASDAALDTVFDTSSVACVPGAGTQQVGGASVLDRRTCLLWQRTAGAAMTNKQAAKYCDGLAQDGFSDWRVPAPEELVTWPNLGPNDNAYITNPTYIPVASAAADGCAGDSHSCNITEYNAGSIACAWQGVGFAGPTVCVRGTAAAGTTPTAFAATTCATCMPEVAGAAAPFKAADCLPYAP
jgi:hypothetical protein